MEDDVATRWLTVEDLGTKTISYAQNGEDILLDRVFGRDHAGFYLDVGANDPVFHSVTKLLYSRGWRGVNIEPTPSLYRRLVEDRPGDVNLHMGISDAEGTLTFYEVPAPLHGWSTFQPKLAEHYRNAHGIQSIEQAIPVTTLDRIFEQHAGRTVDVLKIDAEGFERQVLSGVDLKKWRPRVVLIEAAWPDLWEHYFREAEYVQAAFDGINRYYIRPEDEGLLPAFAAPVNLLDNFISHEVLRLVDELQKQHRGEVDGQVPRPEPRPATPDLGPTILSIALRMKDVARKNPKLAGMVRRLLRRVG